MKFVYIKDEKIEAISDTELEGFVADDVIKNKVTETIAYENGEIVSFDGSLLQAKIEQQIEENRIETERIEQEKLDKEAEENILKKRTAELIEKIKSQKITFEELVEYISITLPDEKLSE